MTVYYTKAGLNPDRHWENNAASKHATMCYEKKICTHNTVYWINRREKNKIKKTLPYLFNNIIHPKEHNRYYSVTHDTFNDTINYEFHSYLPIVSERKVYIFLF